MPLTLTPHRYSLVDRGSKLVGLLAVVAGLGNAAGGYSLALVLFGFVAGVATVFVDVAEEADGEIQ